MEIKTVRWDASRYLDSPEVIAKYLASALADSDTNKPADHAVLRKAAQNAVTALRRLGNAEYQK